MQPIIACREIANRAHQYYMHEYACLVDENAEVEIVVELGNYVTRKNLTWQKENYCTRINLKKGQSRKWNSH